MLEYARKVARQGQQGGGVATSGAACYKISAVSEGQCSGDFISLRDCTTAVGNQRALLWSVTRYGGKAHCNKDCIHELRAEGEEIEEQQPDSSAEEQDVNETEEESATHLDEEKSETISVVMRTDAGYAFVDGRWKSTDDVMKCDDKWGRIKEEVPEVSMSTSNQEMQIIRKTVVLIKQAAKVDPIENTTPRPQWLQRCSETQHQPWILEISKSSEAANVIR